MKSSADSLYYCFTPFLFAMAGTFLLLAHFIYSQKFPNQETENDDEQALIGSDSSAE